MIRNLRLISDKKNTLHVFNSFMYGIHQWWNEVDFDAHEVSDHTRYHKSSRFLINVPSWMILINTIFSRYCFLTEEAMFSWNFFFRILVSKYPE